MMKAGSLRLSDWMSSHRRLPSRIVSELVRPMPGSQDLERKTAVGGIGLLVSRWRRFRSVGCAGWSGACHCAGRPWLVRADSVLSAGNACRACGRRAGPAPSGSYPARSSRPARLLLDEPGHRLGHRERCRRAADALFDDPDAIWPRSLDDSRRRKRPGLPAQAVLQRSPCSLLQEPAEGADLLAARGSVEELGSVGLRAESLARDAVRDSRRGRSARSARSRSDPCASKPSATRAVAGRAPGR